MIGAEDSVDYASYLLRIRLIRGEGGERIGILGGLFLLIGPGDEGDFRAAIPSKRQEGPAEAAIHVQDVASTLMPARDPPPATRRQPERGDTGDLPLTAMTVAAQNQVDGVVLVQHVEDVGRMRKEQREPLWGCGWNAS